MKENKFLLIALAVIVLGISSMFIILNKNKGVVEDINIQVKELPLRIESTSVNFNIVNKKEGNVLECIFKNDSTEDISRVVLEVKLKDTGETVELRYNDFIEAGKESAKFTSKGPASGKLDDVEVLKYKISTRNGVYMEYDTELKQYNWS